MNTEALSIQKRIQDKGNITVYRYTDHWKPAIFNYRTPEEVRMFSLEILHNYGVNHKKYNDYSQLYLSLEELFKNLGSNDEYFKKTFIVSFELNAEDVTIKSMPDPYSSSKVRITTNKEILPHQINIYNLEENTWSPLDRISIAEYLNRDDVSYLIELRKRFPTPIEQNKSNQEMIQEKMDEIRDKLLYRIHE